MSPELILLSVFFAVLLVAFSVMTTVFRRREVSRNVAAAKNSRKLQENRALDDMLGSENDNIKHYFEVMSTESKDSIKMRLIRAGFFNRSAMNYYNLVRIGVGVFFFVAVFLAIVNIAPATSNAAAFMTAMIAAGLSFIGVSFMLDNMGKRKEIAYRKLFPDFIDLMIVCIDAGLSFEGAVDRVTREFLTTHPDFGTHLGIIGLEIRAGRPAHEALANFADRTSVEEARSLAILFRQSEELGASITKTLRTYSSEMRTMRILRAEEKANKLPVKMIFPIGLFMFPVNLVIVLVPVLVTILKLFLSLSPPAL